jgi:hypothetical protein
MLLEDKRTRSYYRNMAERKHKPWRLPNGINKPV